MLVFPQACRDFLDLAETHSRRWQRALQYEREQRTHLEETIEQLAKQHNSLERAWRQAPTLVSTTPSAPTTNKGETDCMCIIYSSGPQCGPHYTGQKSCVTSGSTLKTFIMSRKDILSCVIRFELDYGYVGDGNYLHAGLSVMWCLLSVHPSFLCLFFKQMDRLVSFLRTSILQQEEICSLW